MNFGGDRRGVTVQVGAVLLLGVLVIGLSIYQATVVPAQNRQVEFDHSRTVQDQMVETRNAIVRTAGDGTTGPAAVDLGTDYPPRTLFVNPPPATGTLRTVDTTDPAVNVTVRNLTAVDPEVDDYWDGSRTATYGTGGLVYQADYNVLDSSSTVVYENSVLYDRFDDGVRARTGQTLVDGRTVTLVLLNGSLRESGVAATALDPEALSVSTRSLTVRNETSNVTVTVPTSMPESEWNRTLGDEPAVAHDVVSGGPGGTDLLELTLFSGRTYELRVAQVGLGDATDANEGAYLTEADPLEGPLVEGETERFTVEVRDRFNNPVTDVEVTANVTSPAPTRAGEFLVEGGPARTEVTRRSGAEGQVTFAFVPTNSSLEPTVNVTIDDGASDHERVRYERLLVAPPGSGGGAGGGADLINPQGAGRVTLVDRSTVGASGTNPVELTFQNETFNRSTVNVTDARVSFYLDGNPSASSDTPDRIDLFPNGDRANTTTLIIGNRMKPLATEIPLNVGNTTLELEFTEAGGSFDVQKEDLYVLTLRLSTGETYTYFVTHPRN